jgi:type I restriction enzyme M protein
MRGKVYKGILPNKIRKKMVIENKALESATRKKIDSILNNLGWKTDEESKDCNAFTEQPKTLEQKKKLRGKFPDYVLYESKTDNPIAIIEAKRKGQSLDKALSQAINLYAKPLNVPIVFVYDSTFVKTLDLRNDKELTIDGQILKELISEKRLLRFLKNGSNIEEVTPEIKYTREELIKIFDWANNLLRKEGLRNLDRFVEFANILFIKIVSEIEEDREENGLKRRLDKSICWESFADETDAKKMLNYINNSVLKEGLAKEYNHTDDIFQEKLKIKNPDSVKQIVNRLSTLKLINTESEIKGDAFEYFLKSLASGNDLGEYFTPRHIVKLMVDLLNPKFGETILDPFCGTGGFLIEAFREMKEGINEEDKKLMKRLKEISLFGVELTDTYKIAKMNMIITGDGHNNIVQSDTAKREYWDKIIDNEKNKEVINEMKEIKENGFNVILSNIPYAQKTDYGKNYPIPSNNGDSIFIQNIILSLAENGRCGVIVPEGFLFRRELKSTRQYLLENCSLDAIISLPSGVFMPYTGVKTDILIFTKGKPTKKVWFFKVDNDGFGLNVGRKRINGKNDIDLLLEIWNTKEVTNNSWFSDIDEIKKNDWGLLLRKEMEKTEDKNENPKLILKRVLEMEEKISLELKNLQKLI